ncbi:MAG: hypothetical protein LBH76_01950, partial [Propionibacteriaceae bacterium]|nr:hypothetical protein [Propionibacteriaceae bacterium]
MRRGVYFDGWFPGQHNYHPSLPARRLRMVDELVDMHATTLVWAALGGGSVSLPYLEEEAHGAVPDRFRIHGFVNDAAFIRACARRGIEVFGVVFEAQGWEFPTEVDDDGAVNAVNELPGEGRRGWMGLREFSEGCGPAGWSSLTAYFPDGLANGRGEPVTDLWNQACCVDLDGVPLHATWVEAPDRAHECHYMDRNNPAWRDYLKAVIRLQIDAGVAGVQLDESETPFGALVYGGCFCSDCADQFRDWLAALAPDDRPAELAGVDLGRFDYPQYLRGHGVPARTPAKDLPLGEAYIRFSLQAFQRSFGEIADYIAEYGRSVGRQVLRAGNFYNANPEYAPLVSHVDVMVTEMRHTMDAQPWWFRHVEGFAHGRDVLVAENPYGGVVPALAAELDRGRGHDRLRTSLYEGAAMGPSMTFPYGSWLGAEIQDAFWAPRYLLAEVGGFLAATDHLRGHRSRHEVVVLFPAADAFEADLAGARWANNVKTASFGPSAQRLPYWAAIEALAWAPTGFDVLVLPAPDDGLSPFAAGSLAPYRTVV